MVVIKCSPQTLNSQNLTSRYTQRLVNNHHVDYRSPELYTSHLPPSRFTWFCSEEVDCSLAILQYYFYNFYSMTSLDPLLHQDLICHPTLPQPNFPRHFTIVQAILLTDRQYLHYCTFTTSLTMMNKADQSEIDWLIEHVCTNTI